MPTSLPAPFRPDRPIALIGLMGAGKSSIGRRLAARLGLPFIDSDDEIERAAGCSVAEIFERKGEAYFRDREERVIARLAQEAPRVIAIGGGAFLNERTRGRLLDHCIVIWLQAETSLLAKRVGRGDDRPLLRGQDVHAELARLAKLRDPVYAAAPITVRSEDVPQEQTVDRIIQALGEGRA